MPKDRFHCPESDDGHDKAFANFAYTSYPPQYPWICRNCGYRGVDVGNHDGIVNEYELLVDKFYGEEE